MVLAWLHPKYRQAQRVRPLIQATLGVPSSRMSDTLVRTAAAKN